MKRTEITSAISLAMKSLHPAVTTMLYGSEARGEARPDSDIDLLILVGKNKVSFADEMAITEPLYDIELKTGILINPLIVPKSQWGAVVTPFNENVMRDGIVL